MYVRMHLNFRPTDGTENMYEEQKKPKSPDPKILTLLIVFLLKIGLQI